MKAALTACACLVALFSTACGNRSVLDTSKLEREIQSGLSQRTGIPIGKVDCPANVKPKKGDRFTCTATAARGGQQVVLQVTQTDSEGAVTWRVARPSTGR
jgi:Domain of unknown function (DUF4333)